MLAPNQVSAPAAIHTSSMPLNVGTALLTSDGCTKIEEPTIVPTTIAVACVSPIVRASLCSRVPMRRGILSSYRRRLAGRLLVDRLNGGEGIELRGALVGSIAFDSRKPQRKTAGYCGLAWMSLKAISATT